jgi:hypothetical protein
MRPALALLSPDEQAMEDADDGPSAIYGTCDALQMIRDLASIHGEDHVQRLSGISWKTFASWLRRQRRPSVESMFACLDTLSIPLQSWRTDEDG